MSQENVALQPVAAETKTATPAETPEPAPAAENAGVTKKTSKEDEETSKITDAETLEEFFLDDDFDTKSFATQKSRSERKREIDTDIDQLADIGSIQESDTESDTDSQLSYIKQKELVPEPDFFEVFGEMPSLSRLSLDVTVEVDDEDRKLSKRLDEYADKGHFVDPLTGERQSSEPEQPEPEPEPVAEEEEEEGEEEEEDLLLPPDIEDDVTLAKVEDDDDTLEIWYKAEMPKVVRIDDTVDYEEIERLAVERRKTEAAIEFLDKIIAEAVEKSEYVDPNTILRESLDKVKLIQELNSKLTELDIEQKSRFFLNRKTVEFFRRKKSYRSILEDNPDTIQEDMEKYKESTALLDQLLGREEELNLSMARITQDLEFQAFESEEEVKKSIKSLEDKIKKALHGDSFGHLKEVIENQLGKMDAQRKEISNVRFLLIQRQHTFGALLEKSSALENIGDGLSLRNHEHLQTENLALTKKIEERNTELFKCRSRCNADLHIMAHIKERRHMLRNTLVVQEQALQELIIEKQECRQELFDKKVTRGKIRNEINHLSFQGGLIDKPALMYDFDVTMERLIKIRSKVEQMRQKHNDLQQKITMLEEKNI